MKPTVFETADLLAEAVAERIAAIAQVSVQENGRFSIALAGGRTPRLVYEGLARPPYAQTIDWARFHVFWSDERCVPEEDPDSNAGSAKSAWLDHVPIPQEQIHRIEGERSPLDAADAYEIVLREHLGSDGRLDLVLLGMGTDGHTASLFPRHQALLETDRWILPVHVTAEPAWRVTMTLPLIHRARNRFFLVTGASKADVLHRVMRGERLPAGLAGHESPMKSGSSTWFVDRAASSQLGLF